MGRVSRNYLLVVMPVCAIAVLIAGIIFRIAPQYIAGSVLAVSLGSAYAWKRWQSKTPSEKGFWIVFRVGLIFAAGAVYGTVQSLQEGWQWIDFLYLIFPTGMAGYLIWYAFRLRRTERPLTPPEPTP